MSDKHFLSRIFGITGFFLTLSLLYSGCTKVPEIPAQEERIEISSISLSQTTAEMLVGETVTLVATVLPPNATDRDKLIWSSSKQSVATITEKGVVQAISPGVSTIMVSAGGKSANCIVTVSVKVVPVNSVSVNPSKLELVEGSTAFLTVSVLPDDATNKTVSWTTDNAEVVQVADDGTLTAVSQGKATVKVVSEDGGKTASCEVSVIAKTVPVSSVEVSSETLELVTGGKASLTAEVLPEDASDKTVSWSSSDENVATVSEDGTVTALSAGEAVITVTTSDGGKTSSCKVTVSEKRISVEGVSVEPESLSLTVGEKAQVTASVTPEDASDKTVTWSSNDKNIAAVSEDGTVTALSVGKAIVTATTKDGEKTASCSVTIVAKTISVTGIDVTPGSLTLEIGKTSYLSAVVSPDDATNKRVTWTSSNKSVATVSSSGLVTAVSAGKTTIKATTQDGGYQASCSVTVPSSASFSGLTLEVINPGTVTIDSDPMNLTIEYSKDGVNWTRETGNQIYINLDAGEKVFLRGDNSAYAKTINGTGYCTTIVCNSPFYAYGNVMSLIDSKNYETLKSFSEEKALDGLFQDSYNLRNHPTKKLELPATGLTRSCYTGMFYNCKGLTSAPALPATTLAPYCYSSMFSGCSGLTTAPVLPATNLADYCYDNMFSDCTSLKTPPALPAGQLSKGCYRYMFWNCSSLTAVPELSASKLSAGCYQAMFGNCSSIRSTSQLPATTLEEDCYHAMFYQCKSLQSILSISAKKMARNSCRVMFRGCTSLTSAPKLQATELADSCYRGMFMECTSLKTAPALPATNLSDNCYTSMFSGCKSLTAAPALPATKMVKECYSYMFRSCSSLTDAPILSSESLADHCYYAMFYDCTSLKRVYNLPAKTLAHSCYYYMFYGCSSLVDAPQIFATTLAEYCCCSMFRGCTSIKTAPKLYATTITKRCYGAMFQGCTSLVTPPELPAVSLPEGCYASMFKECSSLITAPAIPATSWTLDCCYSMFAGCTSLNSMTVYYPIYDNTYTEDWVKGVPSSGKFYTYNTSNVVYGTNAVPSGWTVASL